MARRASVSFPPILSQNKAERHVAESTRYRWSCRCARCDVHSTTLRIQYGVVGTCDVASDGHSWRRLTKPCEELVQRPKKLRKLRSRSSFRSRLARPVCPPGFLALTFAMAFTPRTCCCLSKICFPAHQFMVSTGGNISEQDFSSVRNRSASAYSAQEYCNVKNSAPDLDFGLLSSTCSSCVDFGRRQGRLTRLTSRAPVACAP